MMIAAGSFLELRCGPLPELDPERIRRGLAPGSRRLSQSRDSGVVPDDLRKNRFLAVEGLYRQLHAPLEHPKERRELVMPRSQEAVDKLVLALEDDAEAKR